MPLSAPAAPRKRLHSRRVTYEGWQRDDGLFDIEGHLVDVKDHDTALLSGMRPAGEPVHDMWVRVTIDDAFTVTDIEAKSDRVPYPGGCDEIGDGCLVVDDKDSRIGHMRMIAPLAVSKL